MSDLHDIGSVWETLGADAGEARAKLQVAPIGQSVLAGNILAGIDIDGNRHILFPLTPGEAFSPDLSESNVRLVGLKHEGRTYASVLCVLRDLDVIFEQFARELLVALVGSPKPARAAAEAIAKWRRLFSEQTTDVLSPEAQVGLFGELTALRRVLTISGSGDITSWTGPELLNAQHDFRNGDTACEVKTTRTREGRRVRISSVDQLEPPAGGDLFLLHYRVDNDPQGVTLPHVIAEIVDLGASVAALNRKLQLIGYESAHVEQYTNKFRVLDARLYLVDESFPRIVTSSFHDGHVPAGVQQLQYIIELSNEPPFPLSEAASHGVFQKLAAE